MESVNPTSPQPEPHTLHIDPDSFTESQLINSLNFSIEDLLSKISKVQEDYVGTSDIFASGDSHVLHNHNPNLPFKHTNQTEQKKHFHPFNDTSTQGSSEFSTKKIADFEDTKQNQSSSVCKSHDQCFFDSSKKNCLNLQPSTPNSQSCSLKHIQNDNFYSQKLCLPRKLKSLFTDIKQVPESQIFLEEGGEHSQFLKAHAQTIKQSYLQPQTLELKLSDFQIGNSVGSGKFGQVYLCRHRKTGAIFALKKVFKSTIRHYKMQSQFALELKILYMLNHPNIIKLYAHFCDQYHVFLLMEYIEGGQLMNRLKSKQQYVARVIDQVIDAVQYMHDQAVVHRDIKPQNIVIAFQNTPKLCDFGWAGQFDSKALKTTFCGTLDYVSPEMKDRGKYTSKVDIWSLGVLTYELLTGEAPLKEQIANWKKKGGQMSSKWDWHISYPASISGLGQSFMRNLLKQNPDERASLRFCKNHFFLRKYRQPEKEVKFIMNI